MAKQTISVGDYSRQTSNYGRLLFTERTDTTKYEIPETWCSNFEIRESIYTEIRNVLENDLNPKVVFPIILTDGMLRNKMTNQNFNTVYIEPHIQAIFYRKKI